MPLLQIKLIFYILFQVHVVDNEDREKIVSHSFALDGSWLPVSLLPKLVLMDNVICLVS